MLRTPLLPDWIRNADVHGYVAAHQLCPTETRLFGTESLYGDWGGRVLVLAQDFGPMRMVLDRIASCNARPFSHKDGMRTNDRLQHLAGPLCAAGLVYGSALGNLLRCHG